MKVRTRIILSFLVFLAGSAGLAFLYLYGPTWDTKPVVVMTRAVSTNQIITSDDVRVDRWPTQTVSQEAVQRKEDVVGKTALNILPAGSAIFREWLEMDPLLPKEGEVILPLPSGSIFGVNSSLRARDVVNIMFYKQETNQRDTVKPSDPNDPGVETASTPASESSVTFQNIRVVSVRSSVGNSVMDTPEGKQNDRTTSSDRIYSIEILVSDEVAKTIKDQLEAGYTVWIARMK